MCIHTLTFILLYICNRVIYGLHVLEFLMYCFIFMNNCVDVYSSVTVMNSLNVCMYPIEHFSD